eukprot:41363-Chlamydomonas_euryale.AAC.3
MASRAWQFSCGQLSSRSDRAASWGWAWQGRAGLMSAAKALTMRGRATRAGTCKGYPRYERGLLSPTCCSSCACSCCSCACNQANTLARPRHGCSVLWLLVWPLMQALSLLLVLRRANMKMGVASTGVVQTDDAGTAVKVDDKYAFMAKAAATASTNAGAADAAWDD